MNKKVGNLSFKVPDENEPSFDKPYSESTAQLIDEEARDGENLLSSFVFRHKASQKTVARTT